MWKIQTAASGCRSSLPGENRTWASGAGPEDTTIGGVPGRIQTGTWQVGLGIFTEYLNQRLGEREGRITMTVSDEKGAVSDPMDTCWVDDGLAISPEKYRWDRICGTKKAVVQGRFPHPYKAV